MRILCPGCHEAHVLGAELTECSSCGHIFRRETGFLDFVHSEGREEEKRFYDSTYGETAESEVPKRSIDSVSPLWDAAGCPENRIVLEALGDITGSNVLLLGNGESVKELMFLTQSPAQLVYSDLSVHALKNISARFDLSAYDDRLTFAGIDAHDIPFEDATFDVVYGFAMVHHLPDLERFFSSVMRVLKPGGRAVFMDDAFSPIWHFSKQTWLKPLMRFSHRRTGISPEDQRFSMTGGFKETELERKIKAVGGKPWFVRTSFFTYIFYRGAEKVLPQSWSRSLRRPGLSRVIVSFDDFVGKIPALGRNRIRLIWGFSKPDLSASD